jgi:formylglycine-generating enzyme
MDVPPVPPISGPSCEGLPATCGPSGADNCCNPGNEVTGGTYHRSYDVAGDGSSGDQNFPATVSTFWLDKYEVTVGRFRAFVNAGQGTQANPPANGAGARAVIAGSGWDPAWNTSLATSQAALIAAVKCDAKYQTWTDSPDANEARPMSCINWYEAMAFCIWDGGYLPTEAEWNYAATGGSEQRAYPWSSPAGSTTLSASQASYRDGSNCGGDDIPECALTDLVQVGRKPMGDGRWGQSDLAGNVFEWNLDWTGPYQTTCIDCAQTGSGTSRALRGGSFTYGATYLRASYRYSRTPPNRTYYHGIRCARTP